MLKKDKDSEAFPLDNELNESEYFLICGPRVELREIFYGNIPEKKTPQIFESGDINYDDYCYISLKELLENLNDKKYYNIRKEHLTYEDNNHYEMMIIFFKSLDKYGNPDDVQIGLATD